MQHHGKQWSAVNVRADIRRRRRKAGDAGGYSLAVLLDAMRTRGGRLRGGTVVLIGFPEDDGQETPWTRTIKKGLLSQGARVRVFSPQGHDDVTSRVLDEYLLGADAAIIATDARAFRLVSRKDFRDRGVSIVIPTNLYNE